MHMPRTSHSMGLFRLVSGPASSMDLPGTAKVDWLGFKFTILPGCPTIITPYNELIVQLLLLVPECLFFIKFGS